jgi:hypothetical protein
MSAWIRMTNLFFVYPQVKNTYKTLGSYAFILKDGTAGNTEDAGGGGWQGKAPLLPGEVSSLRELAVY